MKSKNYLYGLVAVACLISAGLLYWFFPDLANLWSRGRNADEVADRGRTVSGRGGSLIIAYTGDTDGYLEPCGCTQPAMGGVTRRGTALDDLRRTRPSMPLLVVETGNALKQSDDLDNPMNRWVVEALDALGTDAVNTTASDWKRLNRLSESGRLRGNVRTVFIASTIQSLPKGSFPVKPYLVQQLQAPDGREAVRVGILAVSPDMNDETGGAKTMSAEESIRRYLPEVDAQSDLVVLLTRGRSEELPEWARKFPGIDLIINGNSTGEGREFPMVGNTVIVESAHAGIAVGMLEVEWDAAGHVRKFKNQLVPLPPMMQESPRLLSIVEDAHKEAVAFEEEEARKSPVPSQPTVFAGPEACRPCHEKAFKVWQGSAHAHAIESLKKGGNQYSRDCVSCHVTGFDMDRGFVNVIRTPDLAKIQCEACHGISTDHVTDPLHKHPGLGVFQMNRFKVKETSCMRCHTLDRSPNFSFATYWKKIEH